ncbi:beta-phosphoglucomutase [Bacillus inaquosorum]|uniref:beta-phosphoglucomutase n=1 Tax=Bacillus inaquosorum TaxID=483913 RepID=UPI000A0FE934|nr:beta-phosphoglucomutase [Bacillus inaquosorum]ARV46471.1 beta-phosphoglucomutase [Bacillus subtilis]MEC2064034.1 beta-phosphoglucomutase [Bacillus inaquosorum]MEC2083536.1 beta-phosphoglucomutase [Bacillus inaquosorum]QJC90207.1 Bifunctional beta-phosphoglucomutase / glucose-1-phosphate phosphodismutase [Bacillus subtilis]QJC90225.1 Beta-phosphoglucomutase [Bacillus subtilis]
MKAVIFDLDGVITDTAEYHFLAWKHIAEQIDIPFDRGVNESLKGISREESLESILILGGAETKYTNAEKQKLMHLKNQYYQMLISKLMPKDLLPGIGRLLCELKGENIKIGLASSSRNAPEILKRLEIIDDFHAIVDPTALANGKPDPEIFLTAAALLGVSPADCAAIEDAEAGISAIKSAGMFAVGVGHEQSMFGADLVVRNTCDLTLELLNEEWEQYKIKSF